VPTVSRCIERIGDQCVSIAKLVPMSGHETPRDNGMLDMIERMGELAHAQITEAHQALKTRHVSLARDIARQDEEINQLNRDVFQRSLAISDDPELREWAMFMILPARCLERVGDNTRRDSRTGRARRHRPLPRRPRRPCTGLASAPSPVKGAAFAARCARPCRAPVARPIRSGWIAH
jgi:Na+/phosphate symporter